MQKGLMLIWLGSLGHRTHQSERCIVVTHTMLFGDSKVLDWLWCLLGFHIPDYCLDTNSPVPDVTAATARKEHLARKGVVMLTLFIEKGYQWLINVRFCELHIRGLMARPLRPDAL